MTRQYRCVICGHVVEFSGALPELYPFCTARCKLIDLGRWFNEQYTIDSDLPVEEPGSRTDGSEPDTDR